MDERITKPVKWTTRATKDLYRITKFYATLYGLDKARKIATEIRATTEILENPKVDFKAIGAIDETFTHLKYIYRKLITHYCKITYREGKNYTYIVRVFDTRQNLKKNL